MDRKMRTMTIPEVWSIEIESSTERARLHIIGENRQVKISLYLSDIRLIADELWKQINRRQRELDNVRAGMRGDGE